MPILRIVTVLALAMVTILAHLTAPALRRPVIPSIHVLWIVTVEDVEMWK